MEKNKGKQHLIMGGNGFLGSHVARQLSRAGERVRVMVRAGCDMRNLQDVDVEVVHGDIFDQASVRAAMDGCDIVYYCIVDTRCYILDTSVLFRTNVEGLRQVLDVAKDAGLEKFVFTSTIGAIARSHDKPATEDMPFNWEHLGGDYIRSRVQAEELVLKYAREKNLPAVAMCVSNTYGKADWQLTPHGALVADAAKGKLPLTMKGACTEVVGVEDAAQALILAGEKGRIGERYIISESYVDMDDLYRLAAETTGAKPPRMQIPLFVAYLLAGINDVITRIIRKETVMRVISIRLMHIMTPMDHSKAQRELGWHPRPIAESIAEAAEFYTSEAFAAAQASGD